MPTQSDHDEVRQAAIKRVLYWLQGFYTYAAYTKIERALQKQGKAEATIRDVITAVNRARGLCAEPPLSQGQRAQIRGYYSRQLQMLRLEQYARKALNKKQGAEEK